MEEEEEEEEPEELSQPQNSQPLQEQDYDSVNHLHPGP